MTGLDPLSMVCPPGAGCPLSSASAFGLPEILLWVLAFAIVFGVLTKLKFFGRAATTLVSLVIAFFVLMAVPAAVITALASMSTGLLVVVVGLIVFVGLIELSGVGFTKVVTDDKGKQVPIEVDFWHWHSTALAVILFVIAAVIFVSAGGLALIGVASLPTMLPIFSLTTWVIILVALAVLWLAFGN